MMATLISQILWLHFYLYKDVVFFCGLICVKVITGSVGKKVIPAVSFFASFANGKEMLFFFIYEYNFINTQLFKKAKINEYKKKINVKKGHINWQ